ncbi:class I SAM-dependent methyltransferase [Microbacterium sp. SLBN-154]|uniref:class I SAM-dependent methyltransferase n=1 Tax=Microbacterium sp. SLBN-154 TaxID=2768458 RepID=UPI001F1B3940|nr:class I SAM-dependent methyltransferase [Microbacterium sp. SLBN-154]
MRIAWEDARAVNLANWQDRAALHEEAYGLEAFDDPEHLSEVASDDLAALLPFVGTLRGKDLCHLQCHIGTDTVSLARAGARVTALDFSDRALEVAARPAERAGVDVTWVLGDVLEARTHVSGDFDIVYTSVGTIGWLRDLDRWAMQIAALLRPGGLFYIRDGHPMLYTIDEDADDDLVRHRYFADGTAQMWDDDSTYAGDGKVAHSRTYEWPHPLSETINSLISAGLRIEKLEEGRVLPWRFSGRMVPVDHGWMWPEGVRDRIPATFTIIARKPA